LGHVEIEMIESDGVAVMLGETLRAYGRGVHRRLRPLVGLTSTSGLKNSRSPQAVPGKDIAAHSTDGDRFARLPACIADTRKAGPQLPGCCLVLTS
jgi:hypothetical protein